MLAVFWLVTVFAILCSIGATLAPIWRYLPLEGLTVIAFIFWPLPALALVITCPANQYVRCIIFALFGLAALITPNFVFSGPGLGSTAVNVIVFILGLLIQITVGLVFWSVQTFFILGVIDYFRTRGREK
jgi:hypothetical protein